MSEAVFINVEVDPDAAADPEIAAKLAEVCPVDIFAAQPDDAGGALSGEAGGRAGPKPAGRLEIVEENLDECVLCELCINASPEGVVRVIKLYSGETLPA